MKLLPKDYTPAQRALFRAIEMALLAGACNALFVAISLISNSPTMWQVVLISAIAQGMLVILSALSKYFKASGELPLSMIFELARQELATVAPAVKMSETAQQLDTEIQNVILGDPTNSQDNAKGSEPVAIQESPKFEMPAEKITTLPTIAAIPATPYGISATTGATSSAGGILTVRL